MLNFGDADTTQKATGATSARIDFVCVICTSNSSTSAVASLSLPLSLGVFVQGYLTTISPFFLYLPFNFFAATTKCLYNDIYSLLPQHKYILRMCKPGGEYTPA